MFAALSARRFSTITALAVCFAVSASAHAQLSTGKSKPLPHKDPMLATIFGIVLPGAGQLYAERYGKSAAIFGATALATGIAIDASHDCTGACHGVSPVQTGGIIAAVLIWGYGWATAGTDARLHNNQMLNTAVTPFLDGRNGRMLAGFSFATR